MSQSVTVCQGSVVIDFETRNTGGCKLEVAGAWRYAADPATEILTLVYQQGDGDSLLWTPEQGNSAPLADLAADLDIRFVCFAGFEPVIWQHIMVERYGFAAIPIERWVDTQAIASYYALPRSLGKVLPVIGAPVVKDTAGARLVRGLSRPHRRTGAYPELTPAVLERVHAYNKIDVAGTVVLANALGDLPERERRVWELDQRINQRGLGIDIEFVRAAKRIAEGSSKALLAEFAHHTGGLTPYQVAKTREWLKSQGYPLANLQEETVAEALEQGIPNDEAHRVVRRVLQIREITTTSVKKLDAMLACVGSDGHARGLLQYHAATPGRWSGALVQPQNLPRPTLDVDPEKLVAAIKTGKARALRRWGKSIEVLAGALRYAIVAGEGMQFGIGDFSMIEACILLALAGQRDKCDLIASGTDIYRDMSVQIFGLDQTFITIPEEELTVEQTEHRRIGKNTVLGCGYQMGAPRFRQQYLRHLPAEEATTLSERIIHTYRREWAPAVPKLWRDLEQTARRAMLHPGVTAITKSGISYRLEEKAGLPILICRLLNGKDIHYVDARLSGEPDLWGRAKLQHADAVETAAFDPKGERVVTASLNSTARICDAQTGIGKPLQHGGMVMTAAFDPKGERVVTASLDKTARI